MSDEATIQDVEEHLPELEEITDPELARRVVEVWADALEAVEAESIADLPRSMNPVPDATNPRTEKLLPHIRDVTVCAIALTDLLSERMDVSIDRDAVVASSLVHDVSKTYELSETILPGLEEFLPHPHYGIHLLAEKEFPLHILHIVAAHSHNTAIEPATVEAELVYYADMAALQGLFWSETGELAGHV